MDEVKERLIDEYTTYFRTFVDNLTSMEKYSLKLVDENSRIHGMYKRNNDPEVFILETVINYIIELEKDKPNVKRLESISKLIETNETAAFIFNNLDSDEKIFSSKNSYISLLIHKANTENKVIEREKKQLVNTYILNIISSFEILISNLYKFHLKNVHQDKSFYEDKKISYSELSALKTKDDALTFLIEKHIKEVFHAGFNKWVCDFVKNCTRINENVFENEHKEILNKMNETFERRNLIVHNNGIINYTYLKKVDSDLTTGLEIGDKIKTDLEYIKDRIEIFLKLGIKLTMWNFKKGPSKNEMFAIDIMNQIGLDTLIRGKNELAREIFTPLSRIDLVNQVEYYDYRIIQYNLWLTYKLDNEIDLVMEEIVLYKEENADNLDVQDNLAIAILISDVEEAIDLAIEFVDAIVSPYEKVNIVTDWPIFNPLRNEDRFVDFVKKVYYNENELEEGLIMQPINSPQVKEIRDEIKKEN